MRNARLIVGFLLMGVSLCAQTPSTLSELSIPEAPSSYAPSPLRIVRNITATKPFSVVGPRGALLGQQDGTFECWVFPWKLFSNMRITATMRDYPVPIDVNEQAATIDVQPDHTTITYSHANFTIRQVMFAPAKATVTGAAAYFQIEAVRPLDLTFSFTPEMKRIWPAPSDGSISPEWVQTKGTNGFYVLHLSFPDQTSAIAMPGAEYGILAPYQEKPKTFPLQFKLHFDPKRDSSRIYPLLLAIGENKQTAVAASLHDALETEDASFNAMFAANREEYEHFVADHTTVDTPDQKLNEAFKWAEVAINQLRVETVPAHDETALVAGFYSSGDSARPGFGWFFGRDALWSLYAVNSYGDAKLSRQEVEFLLKRQGSDGKIIHEWSQAAELVDWRSLPYQWASADATPLLLMEMQDYLSVTGDKAFVQRHWASLEKAWQWVTSHDSDGDGILDNKQGTGWVESWPPGMPHQELYLAALDQQASTAFAKLSFALGHNDAASKAEARAAKLRETIVREYYLANEHNYAFSHNADGSVDASATIFPSVAWWDGTFALQNAGPMFSRWASGEFSTDWGTRDLSPKSPFFDPISYHQGTVWPLYTGWTSLAEYRSGRPLSGYAHLMQNANMTWSQDLGDLTELLSGEYFQPLGRSTSHQLWSSAMVITPTLRGLFGIGWDAANNLLNVSPSLPATWTHAEIHHLPINDRFTDLQFTRAGRELVVQASNGVKLESNVQGARASGSDLRVPLPAVEVFLQSELPEPGATTSQIKVLDQVISGHSLTLRVAGIAGSTQTMTVRTNGRLAHLDMDGEMLRSDTALQPVNIILPKSGEGYVEREVHFTW